MSYPYSDVEFSWDDWNQHQNDLVSADPALKGVAVEYRMKLLVPAKYPGRLLRKRTLTRMFQLELSLHWDSRHTGQPTYALTIGYYQRSLPFWWKYGASRILAKLSRADLQDGVGIAATLHQALEKMTKEYGM